jgi:AcrR family transcriptional regulator
MKNKHSHKVKKRPYRMKRRAELEEHTRLRITTSAVELHGTLGPSRVTISALAKHAGVRRSTVYRHFPDELALFRACTRHWIAANPLPQVAQWAELDDVDERLKKALLELYGHYRRTEHMMDNILRDEATMPVIKQMLGEYRQYLAIARDVLMRGRKMGDSARRYTLASICHALAFHTWRSLAIEQHLEDAQVVDLMSLLVAAAQRKRLV